MGIARGEISSIVPAVRQLNRVLQKNSLPKNQVPVHMYRPEVNDYGTVNHSVRNKFVRHGNDYLPP